MKYWGLLLLIIALKYTPAIADATPFKDNAVIKLAFNNKLNDQIDRVGIIYLNNQTNLLDTSFHCVGEVCVVLKNKEIKISRIVPEEFKVIVYIKNKALISPDLKQNGLNTYHELIITEKEIRVNTPVFKTSYKNYSIALFLTILLELIVAYFVFKWYNLKWINLNYIIGINLITHPLLWIISANLTGFAIGNLIGEPIVWIIEGLLIYSILKQNLTLTKSLLLSFLMNLISFLLGGFIYLVVAS